jgi:hypothetical protein
MISNRHFAGAALLGFALAYAGTSLAEGDWKTYPGAMCMELSSDEPAHYVTPEGALWDIHEGSRSFHTYVCPIIRDKFAPASLHAIEVSIYDGSNERGVSCFVTSSDRHASGRSTSTKETKDIGDQVLAFGAIEHLPAAGVIAITCDVPRMLNASGWRDGKSAIQSILVAE